MKAKRKIQKWRLSDIRFIEENINTMTWKEIAGHLGRKLESVKCYSYTIIGITKKKGAGHYSQWTPEEDQRLLSLCYNMSEAEIQEIMGRTEKAIHARIYFLKRQMKPKKAA